MDILQPIIVIFFSVSTMVLSLTLAVVLEAEYRKRRSLHLRFMSLGHFAIGLEFLGFIAGQVLYLKGKTALGGLLIDQVQGILLCVAGLCILFSLLSFLKPSRMRTAAGVAVIASFFVGCVNILSEPSSIVILNGFPISDLTTKEFFTNLTPLVIEWAALAAIGVVYAALRLFKKIDARPHLAYLSAAGFLGFALMSLYIGATSGTVSPDTRMLSEFLVPLLIAALFAGAVSYRHQNPEIARHPWKIFATSVLVRISAMNLAMFLAGCFLIIGITAASFNQVVIAARQAALHTLVEHMAFVQDDDEKDLADLVRGSAIRIGEDGLWDASDPVQILTLSHIIADYAEREKAISYVTILQADGGAFDIFGSSDETDLSTLDAASVLRGETVIEVRRTPALSGAETRIAMPIRSGGAVVAILVGASRLDDQSLNDDALMVFRESAPISYGMMLKDGDVILSVGADAEDPAIAEALSGIDIGSAGQYRLLGHKGRQEVTAHRLSGSGAILYALSPHEANRRTMLILIFTVVIFVFSITMGLAAIQVFSVTTALSPLRKMLLATRRMASGDYRARSEHHSMDEVGELSDSFNGMAETIEARTRKLEDLLRQQKDFMLHTVHELKTPLNHFRWTLELMRFGEVGVLTPEQTELVEQMHSTNQRLERMVQNIVDTEKLSENKLAMVMQEVDPIPVIDDAVGELSLQARGKRIELRWVHPKGGIPKVRADKEQLRRIISNLVGNAVKYTEAGGRIEVAAESRADASGKASVVITVTDNGRGIPKKDQGHLFSRFYRASNVVKKDIEGTGLGLYIVHKLVELHGGSIGFTSEESHGTTFTVTLPAIDPSAA